MWEMLDHAFFQRALAAAALVGFTNGFFSGFVILRRTALSVSALSHTMLPGIAVAILITGALTQLNAFLGALIAAMIVGLGSVAVSHRAQHSQFSTHQPSQEALPYFLIWEFEQSSSTGYLATSMQYQMRIFGRYSASEFSR